MTLTCGTCGTSPVEVRVDRRAGERAPSGDWIRTVCIGCGRFFGYRPAASNTTAHAARAAARRQDDDHGHRLLET